MKDSDPPPATPTRRRRRGDEPPSPSIGPPTPAKAESRPSKIPRSLPPRSLSLPASISAALAHLRSADPSLSPLISTLPPPTFPSPPPPHFYSLARRIVLQQLSARAASAILSRFLSLFPPGSLPTPHALLSLTPERIRSAGVSLRKASYLHDLARSFVSGPLSDEAIAAMEHDDEGLARMLTSVKGIGEWSVHMFLIFSLHRPDVLPVGDLAVRKGVKVLYGLPQVPKPVDMEGLCERWRPYRSVGAWYMWKLIDGGDG